MKTFSSIAAAAVFLCLNVVTGQDLVCTGSCVERWGKCAGEGIVPGTLRPCCNPDDHCVEKSSKFSQCRPKSRDIPASWTGTILTCTDPPECDPTAISARLGGLSANLLVENGPIELDFIFGDYLEVDGCLRECQENPECFAFDETVDAECAPALNAPVSSRTVSSACSKNKPRCACSCTLFGKNLFSTAAKLQPFFDAEIFLTKCFLAPPLCDPATREVRQVNPIIAPNNPSSFHQRPADDDIAFFFVTPADYTLTAGINACRLNRDRLGGCIGFAIEPATGSDGNKVTLLYNEGPGTRSFRGDLAEDPQVYSIEGCL